MSIESKAADYPVTLEDSVTFWGSEFLNTSENVITVYKPYTLTRTLMPASDFEVGHTYRITVNSMDFSEPNAYAGSLYLYKFSSGGRRAGYPVWSLSDGNFVLDSVGGVSEITIETSNDLVLTLSDCVYGIFSRTSSSNEGSVSLWGETTVSYSILVEDVTVRSDTEILESIESEMQKGNEIAEETKETTKGIFSSITDFFGNFFQNLIDTVVSIFVPSAEEMGDLFGQLNDFFSNTFGFLYAPFDYIIQLLGVFTSATGDTGLTFPGFSIMGYEVWPDITYDLSEDELVGTILGYVRTGTGILLAGWFIMYLQDFFKERFGKG